MTKVAMVFGGAGFIGSHLLSYLASTGEYAELISADIGSSRFAVPGVKYHQIDVREPIPDGICFGVTEIYNLAAVHTTPGHEDWEYYCTNVLGAVHIADFARRQGVKRLLFASSISVYATGEAEKDEDFTLQPESAYGRSKLFAEKIHIMWQAERPVDRKLAIVRPGVIYGYSERGNFTRLAKLLRRGYFVFPGRTETVKACGYVKDLVRSMLFMLDRADSVMTYNFCHAEGYTTRQICDSFSHVAGYRRAKLILPLWSMLFAGWIFEVLSGMGLKSSINRARIWKLVKSNNIVPKRLVESGFTYRYDIEQALADWQGTSPAKNFD